MYLCLTILIISFLYLLLTLISEKMFSKWSKVSSYDRAIKELGLENRMSTSFSEEEKKAYTELQEKYQKKYDFWKKISWDVFTNDTDLPWIWFAWTGLIVCIILVSIGWGVDRSYCLKKIAKCEQIERNIADGYIYKDMDVLADLKIEVTEEYNFATKFPFFTFYNQKLIKEAYDKTLSLEMPKFEDTREYVLSINKNVEVKTIE